MRGSVVGSSPRRTASRGEGSAESDRRLVRSGLEARHEIVAGGLVGGEAHRDVSENGGTAGDELL